ncbi:hypothetical protein [Nonomuraea sp. NPDC049784]|uniref:hypothetical protein n=1 Tax=Nonomuraea sp. NPDC049784 TaxID=3154361 RepID=UPI00340B85A0
MIVTARYILAELDNETELLRILALEARTHPDLVEGAVHRLVSATYAEFAAWLAERTGLAPERAEAVAAVGLGALLSSRLLTGVLGVTPTGVDDETFVTTWVDMMTRAMTP